MGSVRPSAGSTESVIRANQDERLLPASPFGAPAVTYAEHRPDHAADAVLADQVRRSQIDPGFAQTTGEAGHPRGADGASRTPAASKPVAPASRS
ncbi:hypothetical protein [Streptomyces incarnatus]|uniref:hypothetical protein n=1 Tax=Streptomyces incarnatus TaxID=665007 RepID=UPI001AD80BFE|nr:hypothetical protein [Streptomyces incarnatus]